MDIALYEKIHADPNIDYLNIHIWPYNWGWAPKDSLQEKVGYATGRARDYIDEHLAIGRSYGKPVVLEEFGFPRDGFCFALGTPTESRDAFYASVFEYIVENKNNSGNFVGCNFWGWGGLAVPSDESVYWKKGAPYTGDPAQEEQGLNSVFLADTSTIDLIRKYTAQLQ